MVQLPLQQLAWLVQDQDCRMVICGQGAAGAVAQHAALHIQQLLKSAEVGPEATNASQASFPMH